MKHTQISVKIGVHGIRTTTQLEDIILVFALVFVIKRSCVKAVIRGTFYNQTLVIHV